MPRLYPLIRLIFVVGLGSTAPVAAQTFPAVPAPPPTTLRDAPLRDWLRQNWYDGKRTILSYSTARARLYNYVDNQQGLVRCVYSGYTEAKAFGFSSTSTTMQNINCEHTVPQSWFNEVERMRSDIHHLFPAVIQWNADRGNDPFAEIPDAQTTKWIRGLSSQSTVPTTNLPEWSEDTNTKFEPRDDHKGNLARAVLYFYTMHATQTFDAGKNVVTAVGDLNTLYQWHLQDPVDALEQLRNRRAAASQGNYNPYINDPSLVARAWGFQGVGITPTVAFAAASGTQTEGPSGSTTYTLTVALTAEPTATATVQVAVSAAGTTATSPADYTFTSPQTLTFGPGLPTSQAVTVTVAGDATVEPDETVRLLLQNPTGPLALGSTTTHDLTIPNDDVAAGTVALAFAKASASAPEGNSATSSYTVNVTLSAVPAMTVTVPITVDAANTSADATDYTLNTTTVTFTTAQASRAVTVTLKGDATVETDRVLSLRLGTPTGPATLGTSITHSLTIRNDDAAAGGEALTCGGLFFSEYIESTSGSNKAVEIYNPSNESVSLAGYQVKVFNNGAITANTTLNLTGTLGSREVYVIINSLSTDQAFLEQGDAVSSVTNFNGNDALTLSYNGTVLDAIGIVGVDPGTNGWSVASGNGSTTNFTLVRKPTVKTGSPTWSTATAEWTAVGADQYSYLGAQGADECDPPLPVTLISFAARRTGPATVLVKWQTAQEVRNDRFEVEKSPDGRVFRLVGRVAGSGTTAAGRYYELPDSNASQAAYYRLRQVDLGGTAALSAVVYVAASTAPLTPSLWPNPLTSADALTLRGLTAANTVTVALHSAYGQTLLAPQLISAADADDRLSAALRPAVPGVYVVVLTHAGERHFLRVLKQ
ncbi:MAG: endonuclease [Hymenobacteraceae bacterium]|nr:endonuclease [Hymenobacteraceae bacterium]